MEISNQFKTDLFKYFQNFHEKVASNYFCQFVIYVRFFFTKFGHAVGWGSFHLGLSGSNDPEPGRCRRTDGKKWRCAREAVPDQKYCERHINRGRHRSRKPVESRKGQAVSGTTNITEVVVVSSPSETVMSSSGTSKSLSLLQHQSKNLQSTAANPYPNVVLSRWLSNWLVYFTCI